MNLAPTAPENPVNVTFNKRRICRVIGVTFDAAAKLQRDAFKLQFFKTEDGKRVLLDRAIDQNLIADCRKISSISLKTKTPSQLALFFLFKHSTNRIYFIPKRRADNPVTQFLMTIVAEIDSEFDSCDRPSRIVIAEVEFEVAAPDAKCAPFGVSRSSGMP